MSRSLVVLIVVLVAIVGLLFFLAGRDLEKPQSRVEKVVPIENLSN
jgi:hypothetical protein